MRRMIFLLVATALLAAAVASPAWARATRTPFTATQTTTPIQPGKTWQSGHILHVRGEVDQGTVTGDLTGTITVIVNLNLDLNSDTGPLFGKFTLVTSDVTWSGSFSGSIGQNGSSGRVIGQGTDGTKLDGTFTQVGENTLLVTGTILNPHG